MVQLRGQVQGHTKFVGKNNRPVTSVRVTSRFGGRCIELREAELGQHGRRAAEAEAVRRSVIERLGQVHMIQTEDVEGVHTEAD